VSPIFSYSLEKKSNILINRRRDTTYWEFVDYIPDPDYRRAHVAQPVNQP